MTTEQLIAATKARRAASVLHMIVEYDGREDFHYYAKDKTAFDRQFAKFKARVGKPDVYGKVVSVSVA